MTGILFLSLSTLSGALFAGAALGGGNRLLAAALGPALGAGVSSLCFFLLLWSGVAAPAVVWTAQTGLLGLAAFLWWRGRAPAAESPASTSAGFALWTLRAAVLLSVALLVMDISATTAATPDGDWDAFAIWNLRARFLAAGPPAWEGAIGAGTNAGLTGASHPGYPLLLSGWIGMSWMVNGSNDPSVAAVAGGLLVVATVLLLFAALRALRGEWSGLLAVLLLLATEAFRSQTGSQYADIPLSLFVLAATALFALALRADTPALWALGGFTAGLAAWTKNEGWPFALCALLIPLLLRRSRILPSLAGFLPPLAVTLLFKTLTPAGSESAFPATFADAFQRLAQAGRWGTVLGSYLANIGIMGFWYAHPLLLLVILAFALRFSRRQPRSEIALLAAPPLALAAAAFGILLVTTADLAWHTSTSVARLIIQPWPALLLLVFCLLNRPEDSLPTAAAATATPDAPPDRLETPPRRQPGRRAKG
jgi:hypothetical protein